MTLATLWPCFCQWEVGSSPCVCGGNWALPGLSGFLVWGMQTQARRKHMENHITETRWSPKEISADHRNPLPALWTRKAQPLPILQHRDPKCEHPHRPSEPQKLETAMIIVVKATELEADLWFSNRYPQKMVSLWIVGLWVFNNTLVYFKGFHNDYLFLL